MPYHRKQRKKRKAKPDSASRKGPVRTIIDQCPHRMTGAMSFPGVTVYPAVWESNLERFLICLLVFCFDVSKIMVQAVRLAYFFGGKAREYTPDLEIVTETRTTYIEVKPLSKLIQEPNLQKYLAIAEATRSQGEQLDFITDDQLPRVWVSNAHLLLRYLRQECAAHILEQVGRALVDQPHPIQALLDEPGSTLTLSDVYALVAQQQLCIDWNRRLDRRALVSLPDKPFRKLSYETIRTTGRFADLVATMAMGHRPPDRRLLAAASARRRALSGPSPVGFVGGFSPAQLGHLKRQVSRHVHENAGRATSGNGPAYRANTQPTTRR